MALKRDLHDYNKVCLNLISSLIGMPWSRSHHPSCFCEIFPLVFRILSRCRYKRMDTRYSRSDFSIHIIHLTCGSDKSHAHVTDSSPLFQVKVQDSPRGVAEPTRQLLYTSISEFTQQTIEAVIGWMKNECIFIFFFFISFAVRGRFRIVGISGSIIKILSGRRD